MKTIFPELPSPAPTTLKRLRSRGILNPDNSVVSWSRLSPFLSERKLTSEATKRVIQIEYDSPRPRKEILNRLVRYLYKREKTATLKKLNK